MFARWGRFVYRFRWATLVGSALLLGLSVVSLLTGAQLAGNGGFGSKLPAGQAAKLINDEIQAQQGATGSSMSLLFSSPNLSVTDPAYSSAVEGALADLSNDPRVTALRTPYDVPSSEKAGLVSRDGHMALVVVELKDSSQQAQKYFEQLVAEVRPGPLSVVATGNVPINQAFNTTLEQDLRRAELVALPVVLILLVLIFASIVAAFLPLGVGVLAIVGGIGGTLLLAHFTDVSQYAINVVTLIGLGVAIDYSLFIVNRFRDELASGASREDAIAIAMSTAGRAITFSGITVAIGLSAMLFYQGTFLASMGAAGATVVGVAVLYGLTFLPALLSVLGDRVNWLNRITDFLVLVVGGGTLLLVGLLFGTTAVVFAAIPVIAFSIAVGIALRGLLPTLGVRPRAAGTGAWHSMAMWVMRRPWLIVAPALVLLVLAGTPFLQLRMAQGGIDQLPPSNQARQGYDTLVKNFPGRDQTSIEAVVYYPDSQALTSEHIGDIYDLSRRLAATPNVQTVQSIVDLDPSLTKADYQRLYSGPSSSLPQATRQALSVGSGPHIVLLNVLTSKEYTSDDARAIVNAVRAEHVPGGQVLATGETAFDLDVVHFILQRTPIAVGSVIAVTYVVLFLLTGSVVLPFKAVVTNLFSISASFGAMVFVFQEGHFSKLLGFTPQSIDPSIPVILFSIVFGMSMDYEVLLISRIQEEYQRTGDNQAGVAIGLEKSGRLITGAAAIMVAVFISFGLADVVIIKAIGIGLAIAVAIDATIVRILIVPAVMRILGRANWWAPRPLMRLHRRIGAGDRRSGTAAPASGV
ncbi:MAG TPA: MMPL family transporter [Candidatus Dormibacteraeota bacterium]|nr:MMPL family transporter [Candidatus Dormibacteraeota bacterium]